MALSSVRKIIRFNKTREEVDNDDDSVILLEKKRSNDTDSTSVDSRIYAGVPSTASVNSSSSKSSKLSLLDMFRKGQKRSHISPEGKIICLNDPLRINGCEKALKNIAGSNRTDDWPVVTEGSIVTAQTTNNEPMQQRLEQEGKGNIQWANLCGDGNRTVKKTATAVYSSVPIPRVYVDKNLPCLLPPRKDDASTITSTEFSGHSSRSKISQRPCDKKNLRITTNTSVDDIIARLSPVSVSQSLSKRIVDPKSKQLCDMLLNLGTVRSCDTSNASRTEPSKGSTHNNGRTETESSSVRCVKDCQDHDIIGSIAKLSNFQGELPTTNLDATFQPVLSSVTSDVSDLTTLTPDVSVSSSDDDNSAREKSDESDFSCSSDSVYPLNCISVSNFLEIPYLKFESIPSMYLGPLNLNCTGMTSSWPVPMQTKDNIIQTSMQLHSYFQGNYNNNESFCNTHRKEIFGILVLEGTAPTEKDTLDFGNNSLWIGTVPLTSTNVGIIGKTLKPASEGVDHISPCDFKNTNSANIKVDHFLNHGHIDLAINTLVRSLDLNRIDTRNDCISMTLRNIATLQMLIGQFQDSVRTLKEISRLEIMEDNPSCKSITLMMLGLSLYGCENYEESNQVFLRSVISIRHDKNMSTSQSLVVRTTAKIFNNMGCGYYQLGNTKSALKSFRSALGVYLEVFKHGHGNKGLVNDSLAATLDELNDVKKSEWMLALSPSLKPALSIILCNLAYVLGKTSDFELSTICFECALRLQQTTLCQSANSGLALDIMDGLAQCLCKINRVSEAFQLYKTLAQTKRKKFISKQQYLRIIEHATLFCDDQRCPDLCGEV